jgi:ectoine hydroxylase-related dioxygenase (phytanoyl-CoA dioxygenase family)
MDLDTALERDGYAVMEHFLDDAGVRGLLETFRSHEPAHRSAFGVTMLTADADGRAAIDQAIKAVFQPRLETLLDGYRICFANFLNKEPQREDVGAVPLHQDPTFVDETRYRTVGLWVPLVDTAPENGGMMAVPGSHRYNKGPRAVGAPFPYRALEATLRPLLRPVPLRAGSAMIFFQSLIHASPPNRGLSARPVAGALMAPRDAQLYCYYCRSAPPRRVEVYEVDDLFYTRYAYGTPPTGVPQVDDIAYWHDSLLPDQLRAT